MRLNWTIEQDGSLMLRCPAKRNAPFVVVKHRARELGHTWGYVAIILEPGLPESGPYKMRSVACDWAMTTFKRKYMPDAEFGEVPQVKKEMRHANQTDDCEPVDRDPGQSDPARHGTTRDEGEALAEAAANPRDHLRG